MVCQIQIMKPPLPSKCFTFGAQIGSGSFGTVFEGQNVQTGEKVAIKKENLGTGKPPQLIYEMQVLKAMNGECGFPRALGFWKGNGFSALAMTLVGQSLNDIFVKCRRKFTVHTVLMLADQLISRLEFLHEKNVIHRDIKPENFAIGLGREENVVYLLDFGLSKTYRDPITHIHIPRRDRRSLVGTVRYASVNNHFGVEVSRRDDLESLAYVLLYFLRGHLPWQGVHSHTKEAKMMKIQDMKERITVQELCDGLPGEFGVFLHQVKQLGFDERPKYSEYRALFRDAMIRLGYTYDYKWCWYEPGAMQEEPEDGINSARPETVELGIAERLPKLRASRQAIMKPEVLPNRPHKPHIHRSHRSKPLWMKPLTWL